MKVLKSKFDRNRKLYKEHFCITTHTNEIKNKQNFGETSSDEELTTMYCDKSEFN